MAKANRLSLSYVKEGYYRTRSPIVDPARSAGQTRPAGRLWKDWWCVRNWRPNVELELTHDHEIGIMGCRQFVVITDGGVRRSTTLMIVGTPTRMTATENRQQ